MNDRATTAGDIRMKGSGYYSLATTGAKIVIDGALPMILGALDRMEIPDNGTPFAVADMGCADGGTSIDMIGEVLRQVRGRAPSRPLEASTQAVTTGAARRGGRIVRAAPTGAARMCASSISPRFPCIDTAADRNPGTARPWHNFELTLYDNPMITH